MSSPKNARDRALSPKERARARQRLQLETPLSDDASLLKLQAQAADYVREAKTPRRLEADELVSMVVDAVARDYFRHALENAGDAPARQ